MRSVCSPERSKGKTMIPYKGRGLVIDVADEEDPETDWIMCSVQFPMRCPNTTVRLIKEAGAVYIDNSSAFRLEDDVPLVVPEINGEDALKHHGIIANPNCSTIITYMALGADLPKSFPIKAINAVTFQAVSGAGIGGIPGTE